MSGTTNVAENKAASQSSTLSPYVASRGVDGSNATFSHTNEGSSEWFQVDLGTPVTADSIVILNKGCGGATDCLCRMSNANLILMDASNNQVATIPLGDTCGKSTITRGLKQCTSSPTTVSRATLFVTLLRLYTLFRSSLTSSLRLYTQVCPSFNFTNNQSARLGITGIHSSCLEFTNRSFCLCGSLQ
jgi:hypothetical protein